MAKKENEVKEPSFEDLVENPDALADQIGKSEEFVKNNKDILTYILVGIIAVVGGFMWWQNDKASAEQDAQQEMFQAVYYFEADSLDKALNGDGNNIGFLDIIADYGSSKAGNLANFYAGVAYLKKGEFDSAIEYLNAFSSDDMLAQARAYSLIGDANMELGNTEEAINFYKKATTYKSNKFFTPQYLMKLAVAFESKDDFTSAADVYNQIITDYPKATEAIEAKKFKAYAENK